MYIKELQFRNVGPYGNILKTFKFDNDGSDGKLWQVLGKNGVGKSFFLKIIKMGLYLETDGILISEVSNSINGDGFINVVYESKGTLWRNESIYSKSKLKSIKIYKDNKPEPEDYGGNQDTKKHLTDHILDMPYYIFNNAVSLSVNDFKSFLSMNAKDTRNIRDRIFGFFIVNEMTEIIKKTLNKHIREQDEIMSSLKNLSENINTTKEKYTEAKKKTEDADADTIKKLTEQLTEYQTKYQAVKTDLDLKSKELAKWLLMLEYLENEANKANKKTYETNKAELENTIKNLNDGIVNKETELKLLASEKEIIILKATKEKLDDAKKSVGIIKNKLVAAEEAEKLAMSNMDTMKNSILDMEKSNKSAAIIKNVSDNISELYSLQTVYAEYTNKKTEFDGINKTLNDKKISIEEKISKLETHKKQLTSRQDLLNIGKCDKCETDLTTIDFVEEKSKLVEDINIAESSIINEGILLKEIKLSIDNNIKSCDEINANIISHSKTITTLVATLKTIVPNGHDELLTIKNFVNGIDTDTLVDISSFKEISSENKFIVYDDTKFEESKKKLKELEEAYQNANGEYIKINSENITKQSVVSTLSEQLVDIDEKEFDKKLKFDKKEVYQNEIDVKSDELKNINTELTSFNKSLATVTNEIENISKGIKTDDHFLELSDEFKKQIDNDDPISMINGHINIINTDINKLTDESSEINTNIISTNTTINNINKQKENDQLETIQGLLNDFQLQYDEYQEKNDKLQRKVDFIKVLEYVLSDECVKAYMLREIVPTINNEIANMLMALGVNLTVIFDDEFKPTIYRFGSEASLGSISTGQKKMVDASILMSITILLLMRYGKFNLVSYDEIFSSLHATSVSIMLELIKEKLCKKLKLNVMLINHSYMSSSYFDKIAHIYHKDNFSFLDIMNPDEYEMMEMTGVEMTGVEASQLAQGVMSK
jgi:DNA repair exonuclease SbcCD ATPase subunit